MIPRQMSAKLVEYAQGFPVICLTGPRQSGKTTLARACFSHYAYVSLENLDTMLAAKEDPRRFLAPYQSAGAGGGPGAAVAASACTR
jgi:predicted AAA+ superfamily ATPase